MVNPIVQKVVPTAVSLLRTPLLLADSVADRLGVGATVHPKVQQGLAALDAVADRVAPAAAPAPASAPAARPEPKPAPKAAEATHDEEEVVEHLTEELLEEEEYAPMAGELADDDELRRVQAELNAKRLVAEQQEQHPE